MAFLTGPQKGGWQFTMVTLRHQRWLAEKFCQNEGWNMMESRENHPEMMELSSHGHDYWRL
jgi:hypothetical protein